MGYFTWKLSENPCRPLVTSDNMGSKSSICNQPFEPSMYIPPSTSARMEVFVNKIGRLNL